MAHDQPLWFHVQYTYML